jgi:gamma-glutamyl:cysteine ligase YbdK (ATP-grasp superfamily)
MPAWRRAVVSSCSSRRSLGPSSGEKANRRRLAREVRAESRFLAARDGMNARLIDPLTRTLVPVRETPHALLAECCPQALALGWAEGARPNAVARGRYGARRQCALAAGPGGLEHLVARVAERFLPSGRLAVTAGSNT